MVFSSLLFLYFFLPFSLLLYWCCPRKIKNAALFFISLVFYAWGEPVYVLLLLASTIVDYFVGLGLERKQAQPAKRRLLLIFSIIANISVLGFFKYYGFLSANLTDLFGIHMPDWDPPLPIGISFYTFQTMSYTIDVYRKKVAAQRNFISFGCYVALFPQLVAGPIVRYETIAHELKQRAVKWDGLLSGARIFLIGLAKKVLLANNIGALWSEIEVMFNGGGGLPASAAWLGMIAFAFQIYFDFSGYSDMAVGLGKMLGFTFPKNFDYPYMSQSITEFWRRWHMTLGRWFRDYVYIPLGGNRVSKRKHIRNIFIVWALTGLWHGASWNFILWGLYFGFILAIEKWWLLDWLKRSPRVVRHLYTCLLIVLGWVLFELENMQAISDYVMAMLGLGGGKTSGFYLYDPYTIYLLISYAVILIICIAASTSLPAKAWKVLSYRCPKFMTTVSGVLYILLLLVCTAYLVDSTYNPFLYFRF